ncbi:hypothetical protein MLD38_004107 [Melastoma candidum]|uniref:Uncharacterized protein n=1 Tax=Melastoma candidum TaxID=119954 RepID=A0ACB9S9A3_9MYRT|nr:hypothetical protein MLD38_004107 [Melastoma candidum]
MDHTPTPAMHDIRLAQAQGITSVLSPTHSIPSLRRTLSADMSSRNWVTHDESWPSEGPHHLPHHVEEDEDEDQGSRFDIWNSIQDEKRKAMSNDRGVEGFEVWGSITSGNVFRRSESETLPTQYVHPLVRRSSSCLSKKSLEICTESLGSETGSDFFLSFLPTETRCLSGLQEDGGEKNGSLFSPAFGRMVGGHGFDAKRSSHAAAAIPRSKQAPRSFPPPIPSLSPAADGGSLRMQSRRENGRLVLEAVSVPPQTNFLARRENGRLVLEVTSHEVDCNLNPDTLMEEQEEADQVGEGRANRSGDYKAESSGAGAADAEGIEWIIRKKDENTAAIATSSPRIDLIGKLTIPKIAIMMNEPDKVREVMIFKRGINGGETGINPMATVMNPQNVYEYFWRTKQGSDAITEDTQLRQQPQPEPLTLKGYANDGETATKDSGEVRILWREDNGRNTVEDCWVSVMKDRRRRPLVVLGPRCIATS